MPEDSTTLDPPAPVEFKAAPATLSADDSQGIVEAIVSVTGVEDRVKDIIEPGAYAKTLAERKPRGVWCADAETEVLTTRGWLTYDQLTTDDEAYTLDTATMTARFEQVEAVNVFPAERRTLRRIETGGFSSLTTLDHRWPIRAKVWVGSTYHYETQWRTTETLAGKHGIYRALPNAETPDQPKYNDAFVELVAWIWNEGHVERQPGRSPRIQIAQSQMVNPDNCLAIRTALDALFPDQWSEYRRTDGGVQFRLRTSPTAVVLQVLGQDKAPTHDFLLSLTRAQLHLFIDTCLAGDGTVEDRGVRRWAQRSDHSRRMFEMACALAGIPTTNRMLPPGAGHLGRPVGLVSLLRTKVVSPIDAITETKSGRRSVGPTRAVDELVEHYGIVWCPTTPSGTWLARRRGTVYFTGNSHKWEEPVAKTLAVEELLPGDKRLPAPIAAKNGGALLVKAQFNLNTNRGREAYEDVKFFGEEQEWSIGYKATKHARNPKTGVRHIKELALFEYSPVLHGAMPLAKNVSVKDAQEQWAEVKSVLERVVVEEVPEAKDDSPPPDDYDLTDDEAMDYMASLTAEQLDLLAAGDLKTFQEQLEAKDNVNTPEGKFKARHLINWFEHGEGAAKIRWGEPGDWSRCVRLASRHMTAENARGFCQLRHKGATGFYAGHAPTDHRTGKSLPQPGTILGAGLPVADAPALDTTGHGPLLHCSWEGEVVTLAADTKSGPATLNVDGTGDWLQVRDANALDDPAEVVYLKSLGDGSLVILPSDSVGEPAPVLPIAVGEGATSPQQAGTKVGPEGGNGAHGRVLGEGALALPGHGVAVAEGSAVVPLAHAASKSAAGRVAAVVLHATSGIASRHDTSIHLAEEKWRKPWRDFLHPRNHDGEFALSNAHAAAAIAHDNRTTNASAAVQDHRTRVLHALDRGEITEAEARRQLGKAPHPHPVDHSGISLQAGEDQANVDDVIKRWHAGELTEEEALARLKKLRAKREARSGKADTPDADADIDPPQFKDDLIHVSNDDLMAELVRREAIEVVDDAE